MDWLKLASDIVGAQYAPDNATAKEAAQRMAGASNLTAIEIAQADPRWLNIDIGTLYRRDGATITPLAAYTVGRGNVLFWRALP